MNILDTVREAVRDGRVPDAATRAVLGQVTDPAVLRQAGRTLAGLALDAPGLRPVSVAVLATCTIGPYEQMLRATLIAAGMMPDIRPGRYKMFELSLGSAEYGETDMVSCLLDESYFLPPQWSPVDIEALGEYVTQRMVQFRSILDSALERSSTTILLHTLPLPGTVRDAVISWRDRARLSRIWHQLNADLLALVDHSPKIAVFDLVSALGERAVVARDDRLHRYGDLPFSDGALAIIADQTRRFAQARVGLSRKVLALDLDNTLWGGVVGEVGAQGLQLGGLYPGNCYRQLQNTVTMLREQGVVLVLASKNDAELVERTLAEHPEVVLRPEAFSARMVNWQPKAANLAAAAASLGLAVGSFVFMDDSPFERGQVAAELPDIAILSAEGDPAHHVRTLVQHGWFDVLDLTETDKKRPELYRTKARRADFSASFGSPVDYLRALGIELLPAEATQFTVARIAQLASRTNQFNLTGVRYDEATTAQWSASPDHLVASFSVRDRFGDEGVVGAVWVDCGPEVWAVTNLVLSCRVLGRDVEIAVAAWLVAKAHTAGASTVEGRFIPSGRNGVAADFWTRAGFARTDIDGILRLDAASTVPSPDWISVSERSEVNS
ncbi:HAD-IIIC family phosphatase [Pseudonocardiaceae bacterium YIM PH 21723]|nr:HAD-IIIC family phosphatase [Pseudonocardiaceae bacterium YIM PH 21723]